jgi:hypothetical protein
VVGIQVLGKNVLDDLACHTSSIGRLVDVATDACLLGYSSGTQNDGILLVVFYHLVIGFVDKATAQVRPNLLGVPPFHGQS